MYEKPGTRGWQRRAIAALARCSIQTAVVVVLTSTACSSGGGGGGGTTSTGTSCAQATQCYANVATGNGSDASAVHGTVTCLTQLQNGYCTHTCATSADCCAVPGECPVGFNEVCASFESSGQMYCFLSCSTSDITASGSGVTDPAVYCQRYANASFTCRSTGGGSANAKFCGP